MRLSGFWFAALALAVASGCASRDVRSSRNEASSSQCELPDQGMLLGSPEASEWQARWNRANSECERGSAEACQLIMCWAKEKSMLECDKGSRSDCGNAAELAHASRDPRAMHYCRRTCDLDPESEACQALATRGTCF